MLENLNDIYHLSMIIAGFYLMILLTVAVSKLFRKDKNKPYASQNKKNRKGR